MQSNMVLSLYAPAGYGEVDLVEASRNAWCESIYVFDVAQGQSRTVHRVHMRELVRSEASMKRALKDIQDALAGGRMDGPAPSDRLLVIGAINPDGFDIHLFVSGLNIVGDFGGLVQDFDNLETAMSWVTKAISISYRLHIVNVRGVPREWRLEPSSPGADQNDVLACGHFALLKRMKNAEHVFLQNRHIQ